MPGRLVSELRAPELGERLSERSVLVQPVGSVEQHGPHLPFNTDLVIAEAVSSAVVERYGDDLDLWLLPPLAYSKSNEHAWAPGTVWLSATTLLAVLMDIGRSLRMLPARRLVFLNGHGGNSALLNVACRELRLAYGLMTFLAHPRMPPDQGGPPLAAPDAGERGLGIHGGAGETSLMLHLRPDLVAMDRAVRRVPDQLADNRHVRFGGPVSFGWLADDFGPDGHIGDPTGATAAQGQEAFEHAVAALGAAMAEVAAFDLPLPHQPSQPSRPLPGP
jgi:creatinine amidohydrolase